MSHKISAWETKNSVRHTKNWACCTKIHCARSMWHTVESGLIRDFDQCLKWLPTSTFAQLSLCVTCCKFIAWNFGVLPSFLYIFADSPISSYVISSWTVLVDIQYLVDFFVFCETWQNNIYIYWSSQTLGQQFLTTIADKLDNLFGCVECEILSGD